MRLICYTTTYLGGGHLAQPHKLFRTLKVIASKMHQKGNFFLTQEGLTMVQAQVLMFLVEQEGHCCCMKTLEKSLDVAQSTSAGVVSRLIRNGFLESFGNPTDKRVKMVKLTSMAETSIVKIDNKIGEVDQSILSVLTEEEQSQLFILLQKLANGLEEQDIK